MKSQFQSVEYGFTVEPKDTSRSFYNQVHGKEIVQVLDADHLKQLFASRPDADGAFTTQNNLELSVFTADCLPVLFFTEGSQGPIGLVHSGWRSAMQKISVQMMKHFPGELHVVLGPCILPCCFEIKSDFIETFKSHSQDPQPFILEREEKLFFDLPNFVLKTQILSTGKQITQHREYLRCTVCSTPSLPSFRRQKSTDPRIRGWIRRSNKV